MTIEDSITFTRNMDRLPPESRVTPVDHSLDMCKSELGPIEIHLANLAATLSGKPLHLSDSDMQMILSLAFLNLHLPTPPIIQLKSNIRLQDQIGVQSVQWITESPVLFDGKTLNNQRSSFEFAYQFVQPNGRIIWKRDAK